MIKDPAEKAKKYLKSISEAKDLFKALDYPPSRIRSILIKAFQDYFENLVAEETLIEVGSILHNLQMETWDSDPDLLAVTCFLDDQKYNNFRLPTKQEREKYYKKCLEDLSQNQTLSVSFPKSLIKKLESISKKKVIQTLIQKAVKEYIKNR